MTTNQDISYRLEEIVDESSLARVIETLAEICNEKADHLRSNWQDEKAAKAWERDARKLDALANKLEH